MKALLEYDRIFLSLCAKLYYFSDKQVVCFLKIKPGASWWIQEDVTQLEGMGWDEEGVGKAIERDLWTPG